MDLLLIPPPPAYHAPFMVEAAAPEQEVVEVREQKRQTLQDLLGLLNQTYNDVHFTMRGPMLHGASWCGRVQVEITKEQDEIRFSIYGTEAGAIGMIRDTEDAYAMIRESLQECCRERDPKEVQPVAVDRRTEEINAMIRQVVDEFCW